MTSFSRVSARVWRRPRERVSLSESFSLRIASGGRVFRPRRSNDGRTPPPLRRDRVNDFVPPSPEEASAAVQSLQGLRQVYSPVFYSLDPESGKVVRGLSGIPDKQEGKPMLFIGNHQTLSLDLGLLVSEVYQEKGVLMRGLAHPVLFNQGGGGFGGVPGAAPQQDAGGAAGRRGEVGGEGSNQHFVSFRVVRSRARLDSIVEIRPKRALHHFPFPFWPRASFSFPF